MKQINESTIKRVLALYIDQAKAQARQHEKIPFIFTSPLPNATNTETSLLNKLCEHPEIVAFLRRTKLPYINLADILSKYYIRSIATAERCTPDWPHLMRGTSFSNSMGSIQSLMLMESIDLRPSFPAVRNTEPEDPQGNERLVPRGQSPSFGRDSNQEQQLQPKLSSSRPDGEAYSSKWGKFRCEEEINHLSVASNYLLIYE